ncbi:type I-E CRISPR-associated endoribonuclease Cas2e [Parasulfuritortus cantonensis]
MTLLVTRNVSDRMRGFLSSSLLELAPGVYSTPHISPAVRERIWAVVADWFPHEDSASVIMVWADPTVPCGQAVRTLGVPPIKIVAVDGLLTACHVPVL